MASLKAFPSLGLLSLREADVAALRATVSNHQNTRRHTILTCPPPTQSAVQTIWLEIMAHHHRRHPTVRHAHRHHPR